MMNLIKDAQQRLRTVRVLMANMSDLLTADHLEAAKLTGKRLTTEVEELNELMMQIAEPPQPIPATAQPTTEVIPAPLPAPEVVPV